MVVLLGSRFFAAGIGCGAAIEESVYYSAGVKQVGDETEMSILFRHCCRTQCGGIEVGPLGGYERATSIG
jgi:predicted transcriptional regulator